MKELNSKTGLHSNLLYVVVISAAVIALFIARSYSYLLFHVLVELVTISIAVTIFILVWNCRKIIENNFIKVIGIGYRAILEIGIREPFSILLMELKQAQEALEKERNRLARIIYGTNVGTWEWDVRTGATMFNERWAEIIGYHLAELEPVSIKTWLDNVHPDDNMISEELLERHFSSELDNYEFECRMRHKDGHWVWVLNSARVVAWMDNGKPFMISGIHQDISERKQMEIELHQAKAAADAANAAKSRFLATMSHEIRTPMNSVIGMIELLQHTKLTLDQHDYAESAKNASLELVQMLSDILDLSKIEADKIELEASDFDLRPVISDTIKLLSYSAHEKALGLTSSIDSDVPFFLKGDPGRLRQIIINLVGNAIKFTSKGAVNLQIRKDIEDELSVTICFLVSDSGIGIATDKMEQIFEPFTQADNCTTRRYGGTGLGLTICRRLAALMGGAVGVESNEDEGSTFWFTVVMEKRASGAAITPQYERGVNKIATTIRILLIDDDPNAQIILPLLLKNYGYQVDVTGNGKEALLALKDNDYSLVLMDCMMPEMNGYEVTAVVRNPASAVRRHDIPIIALTGHAMKQDRDKCIAAGMDDHLPKPLLLPDLLTKLDTWLNGYVSQNQDDISPHASVPAGMGQQKNAVAYT